MSIDKKIAEIFNLPRFVDRILERHQEKHLNDVVIYNAIKNSLSIGTLIDNLAEVFRLPRNQIEQDLKDFGFEDLIDHYKLKNIREGVTNEQTNSPLHICHEPNMLDPFPTLFKVKSVPAFTEPLLVSPNQQEVFSNLFQSVPKTFSSDPFVKLYREDVMGYFKDYMRDSAPQIMKEINKRFKGGIPKYLVTTGIGANEQFIHFVASINNENKDRRLRWLVINSPKNLSLLPDDATIDNTLFMEFSRSSITEETVKLHEYTPRQAHRIVFSNSGPLFELGKRDGNLIQTLPDQVSGRYGRNKTPILLAPMLIAGMDVETFWKDIDLAIKTFDISNPESLPFVLAKFILLHQKIEARNFIYLGCNDDNLIKLSDEFIQFWNEGVNKGGNDLLISRFFGLPRDSHMNIEGLLGNHKSKMAFFLLRSNLKIDLCHSLISQKIDPINPDHEGLLLGDEEVILSFANYKRFSELMPTILLEIPCKPSLKHEALISQLFADITFIYSRLNGIDPGSNPEVKFVRERSAELLSKVAKKLHNNPNLTIENAVTDI